MDPSAALGRSPGKLDDNNKLDRPRFKKERSVAMIARAHTRITLGQHAPDS